MVHSVRPQLQRTRLIALNIFQVGLGDIEHRFFTNQDYVNFGLCIPKITRNMTDLQDCSFTEKLP